MKKRHPANASGNWYVDTSCTDCSAARTVAPGLIVERDGQSVFARQPQTAEELRMAWRARLLCPSASIRTASKEPAPEGLFPELLTRAVYRLGYNAAHAAGAHSFLAEARSGNFMIDSPRWATQVVAAIAERGGLRGIFSPTATMSAMLSVTPHISEQRCGFIAPTGTARVLPIT